MTGLSMLGLLTGAAPAQGRNAVFFERERHANVRPGNTGYPMRAVRTREFLYIRNFRPDRWPAGDPEAQVDPKRPFGDCDDGPTKQYILDHRATPEVEKSFQLCFGKRPAEELYDLRADPHQLHNIAGQAGYASALARLRADLENWMKSAADPRAVKDDDHWDAYPYYGGRPRTAGNAPNRQP
jgi:hypothetical protein